MTPTAAFTSDYTTVATAHQTQEDMGGNEPPKQSQQAQQPQQPVKRSPASEAMPPNSVMPSAVAANPVMGQTYNNPMQSMPHNNMLLGQIFTPMMAWAFNPMSGQQVLNPICPQGMPPQGMPFASWGFCPGVRAAMGFQESMGPTSVAAGGRKRKTAADEKKKTAARKKQKITGVPEPAANGNISPVVTAVATPSPTKPIMDGTVYYDLQLNRQKAHKVGKKCCRTILGDKSYGNYTKCTCLEDAFGSLAAKDQGALPDLQVKLLTIFQGFRNAWECKNPHHPSNFRDLASSLATKTRGRDTRTHPDFYFKDVPGVKFCMHALMELIGYPFEFQELYMKRYYVRRANQIDNRDVVFHPEIWKPQGYLPSLRGIWDIDLVWMEYINLLIEKKECNEDLPPIEEIVTLLQAKLHDAISKRRIRECLLRVVVEFEQKPEVEVAHPSYWSTPCTLDKPVSLHTSMAMPYDKKGEHYDLLHQDRNIHIRFVGDNKQNWEASPEKGWRYKEDGKDVPITQADTPDHLKNISFDDSDFERFAELMYWYIGETEHKLRNVSGGQKAPKYESTSSCHYDGLKTLCGDLMLSHKPATAEGKAKKAELLGLFDAFQSHQRRVVSSILHDFEEKGEYKKVMIDGGAMASRHFNLTTVKGQKRQVGRAFQTPHVDVCPHVQNEAQRNKNRFYVAFMPVEKCGMWISYMKTFQGEAKGLRLLYIPFGCIVYMPASVVHAGGFKTSVTGNRRCHFYIYCIHKDSESKPPMDNENKWMILTKKKHTTAVGIFDETSDWYLENEILQIFNRYFQLP